MSTYYLSSNALYVALGLAVGFGPPLVKRLRRKHRQRRYRATLASVLAHREKAKNCRIWVHRTDAGEFLLKYSEWPNRMPYELIIADSETVNDAVLQLEAAGFTVQDGPG